MSQRDSSNYLDPQASPDQLGGGLVESDAAPTRERILEAAAELFYELGYHGTTTRAVAARVGIQAGSIYNHFPSKQDMLYRIALDTMDGALRGSAEAIDGLDEPEDRLRALVERMVRDHATTRFRNKVTDDQLSALDPEKRVEIVAMRDALEQMHRSILAEGARTAGWQIADVAITAFAIVTMCTAVATWFREDGRLTVDEVAHQYGDLAIAMAKGSPRREAE